MILGALAVFGTSLAFWMWFEALEEVELNRANVFTFLVPILGLTTGALLFDERLGGIQAAGVALVPFGVGCLDRVCPRPPGPRATGADGPIST